MYIIYYNIRNTLLHMLYTIKYTLYTLYTLYILLYILHMYTIPEYRAEFRLFVEYALIHLHRVTIEEWREAV